MLPLAWVRHFQTLKIYQNWVSILVQSILSQFCRSANWLIMKVIFSLLDENMDTTYLLMYYGKVRVRGWVQQFTW